MSLSRQHKLVPVRGAFYTADEDVVFIEDGHDPVVFEDFRTFVARDGRVLEMIYAPGVEAGEVAYHEN